MFMCIYNKYENNINSKPFKDKIEIITIIFTAF